MGDLIDFQLRREQRLDPATLPVKLTPIFYFDVSCPLSYLAAERVERVLGLIEWVSIDGSALTDAPPTPARFAELRSRAEMHARALRLPLEWPEAFAVDGRAARRVAAFACELGAGSAFALAAGRLAFCGGFDLDDPETLAEAAAAAGLPLAACLDAAGETWRDDELRETARAMAEEGIRELPAVSVGHHWFGGITGLMAAGEQLRVVDHQSRPLAPAS